MKNPLAETLEALNDIGGEYETDITLGLAFTRGDVSVDDALRLRRPAREGRS